MPETESVTPAVATKYHDDMVKHVLKERYLKDGETYEDLLNRVAEYITICEEDKDRWLARFRNLLLSNRLLLNSPTLMNAGNEIGQLSACFVVPVEDSMNGISKSLADMITIQKSGGGTGFGFSRLRQEGAPVGSTGKVAGGPVEFMKLFNSVGGIIKQGSKRPGANMAILRVDHPDIEKFINLKRNVLHEELKSLIGPDRWATIFNELSPELQEEYKQKMWDMKNFNISVGITDKFMRAVASGKSYNLVDPHTGEVVGTKDAWQVWDLIATCAWQTGDPGLFFIDEVNRHHTTPHFAAIEATNPCGEQPLMPNEPCNLGSINLSEHVIEGKFQWDTFAKTIWESVRFLDNVVTMNKYPTPDIEYTALQTRRIGLGIMGLADMFIKLDIDYRSDYALELGREVASFLHTEAYKASERLGQERGVYPAYNPEYGGTAKRNSVVLTIAPTGTISMLSGCSSGIEPNFSFSYTRAAAGKEFVQWHHLVPESFRNDRLNGVLPPTFVTAHEVDPETHIEHQAMWQKYIDSAVSKTINMPTEATVEDIRAMYWMAYDKDLKGVTVFRDGCKDEQVISIADQCPNCEKEVTFIRKEGCKACPKCGTEFCG